MVISVAEDGTETVLAEGTLDGNTVQIQMCRKENSLHVCVNRNILCEQLEVKQLSDKTASLAVIVQKFSRMDCDKFAVEGESSE